MIAKLQKALQESENRLRNIVDGAPFPIGVYIGQEMKIMLANKSIMDIWAKGYDVIGKNFADLLPELGTQTIFAEMNRVFLTGEAFHAKNQPVDLLVNGQTHRSYFNYSFTPLRDEQGQVYGVMNTGADVTDLNGALQSSENSERRYRQLLLQAPLGICLLNRADLAITTVNDAFVTLTGRPRNQLENAAFESILPELTAGHKKYFDEILQTGVASKFAEQEIIVLRDGQPETRYVDFVFDPIIDDPGSIMQIMVLFIDVTEVVMAKKKLELVVQERTLALEVSNRNLLRSNTDLQQFASVASHDLQEPLRKIQYFADRLRNSLGSLSAEADRYLSKIENAASRMTLLIKQILTYSQLSADSKDFVAVDLNTVIQNVKQDFEVALDQKSGRFEINTLPVLQGMPVQMQQLFTNLTSNALKFTIPDKSPEIFINCSLFPLEELRRYPMLDKNLRYYCISFADNGIGFDPLESKNIFNIFQRLVTKEEYPGNGLGLALCQNIVENHNGHIEAVSTKGQGATFNILLPVKQPKNI